MRDRYVYVGFRTGLFVHFKHVSVYFVFIVCFCVYVYATAWMWEPEGIFYCVGPGNQAEVARRGSKCFYKLSCLTSPNIYLLFR